MATLRSTMAMWRIPRCMSNSLLIRRGHTRPERQSTYEFMDKAQIEVKGGRGGNGCVSYDVLSPGCKRPSGGSGGKGGNVYLLADPTVNSLKMQTFHYEAGIGRHGGSAGLTGRNGKDTIIKVPVGTIVREKLPSDFFETLEEEGYEASDFPSIVMDKPRKLLLVAEGGKPGIGNAVSGKQLRRSTPSTKMPGEPGETRELFLELKIIADVGLVGYPNAGKSSLLRSLSNATPKVASYPFTTLHPSVGMVEYSDLGRIAIADIPGIIEGAHENRGLGHEFLKHIERTKVLLFVVDMAGVDERRPFNDLTSLLNEVTLYNADLINKPKLLFANKYDLKVGKVNERKIRAVAEQYGMKIITGSAQKGEGLPELARELRLMVERLRKEEEESSSGSSSSSSSSSEDEPVRMSSMTLSSEDDDVIEVKEQREETVMDNDDDDTEEENRSQEEINAAFEEEKRNAVKLTKQRKPRAKKSEVSEESAAGDDASDSVSEDAVVKKVRKTRQPKIKTVESVVEHGMI